MDLRPLIYIAGPYSSDPVGNTRRAIEAGERCWDMGGAPIVPHLSMLWDLLEPSPHSTWMERDLQVIARCDAAIRLAGESPGADREVAYARELVIPVYVQNADDDGLYVRSATLSVLEWFVEYDPTRRRIAEAFTGQQL
jgi:hypothetical protein